MPFKSAKQMRYLAAQEPEVFRRWLKKYGPYRPKKKAKKKSKANVEAASAIARRKTRKR